jgi:hypothetical protein
MNGIAVQHLGCSTITFELFVRFGQACVKSEKTVQETVVAVNLFDFIALQQNGCNRKKIRIRSSEDALSWMVSRHISTDHTRKKKRCGIVSRMLVNFQSG